MTLLANPWLWLTTAPLVLPTLFVVLSVMDSRTRRREIRKLIVSHLDPDHFETTPDGRMLADHPAAAHPPHLAQNSRWFRSAINFVGELLSPTFRERVYEPLVGENEAEYLMAVAAAHNSSWRRARRT